MRENPDIVNEQVPLGFGNISASVGDHVGHFYQTNEEWKEIVVSYYKTGLQAGDKCVYFTSSADQQEMLKEELGIAGVEVEAAAASGQLTLLVGKDIAEDRQHALASALGEVDARRLLRSGGDMTWTETLMDWETHINLVVNPRAVFLCQYDLTAFNGSGVMNAMKTHPICIVAKVVHRNPYYMDPQVFLQQLDHVDPSALSP